MAETTVDQLVDVQGRVEGLIANVAGDQWDRPTVCSEWTVRDLVNHLVAGNQRFAELLAGETFTPPPTGAGPGPNLLGDNPAEAFRDAAHALQGAFAVPGTLERMVAAPIGTVPGVVALHLRITEHLAHGWDLAQATDQDFDVPAEVAEQELAFSRGALGQLPPGRSPFGTPQPVPDDVPALLRLVGRLGRPVGAVAASG